MVKKTMIRKVFVNKKNKQHTVTLSKKEIKKLHPTIKFGEELFVKLELIKKR